MEVVIIICVLLLIAYVFDLTSGTTRIPSVILLLFLGWLAKQLALYFSYNVPNLHPLLSILGTIGLILIVLEGALELEYNKQKLPLIRKSLSAAISSLIVMGFILSWALVHFLDTSWKIALINAIPFCIISSAIAIPSVRNLDASKREFTVYESSLSDILGVMAFNFFALNETIGLNTISHFSLQFILIVIISFIATIGLALLLNKINHHVKFGPIILIIILLYAISKIYHLPGLIFILLFGLFLGNAYKLQGYSWLKWLQVDSLRNEVAKFTELTVEATFIIRSVFFILFGFLIDSSELVNKDTFIWAISTSCLIYAIRFSQLKLLKIPVMPLLFVAPRGLITILLFLSITPEASLALVNKAFITQTILITALMMMLGLMLNKQNNIDDSHKHSS